MEPTLFTHASNEQGSPGYEDAAKASIDDVSHRARMILEYADLLVSGAVVSSTTAAIVGGDKAHANALRLARRDVGRAWEALAACGLVVVPMGLMIAARAKARGEEKQ